MSASSRADAVEVRRHRSVSEVTAEQWNRLSTRAPTPLLHHEWLLHLERSGSITADRGWRGCHVAAYQAGRLVGAAPAYLREHSWGEFVFDFAWAEVAEQIGVPYYPKVVGMSPATPSPGYRLLVDPALTEREQTVIRRLLLDELRIVARENGAGMLQFNFVEEAEAAWLQEAGWRVWLHHGFRWTNPGYRDFADFLARFDKNQRRNIRREWDSMRAQGLRLRMVHATEAPAAYFEAMAAYYRRTNDQFGPYAARFMTTRFFTTMDESVRRWVWFAAAHTAEDAVRPVALAMLLIKDDHMLGRYWGTRAYYPNLHFALCYYLPMHHAIEHGIRVFDPGMGSEHKIRRGFESVPNYSLHEPTDPTLRAVWDANMPRINAGQLEALAALNEEIPWRTSGHLG